uniref:Putative secreted protein n=1 Tax=Anopheles marajoara TaxID=58244 RepID=A0A2M4CCA7_9DIPT
MGSNRGARRRQQHLLCAVLCATRVRLGAVCWEEESRAVGLFAWLVRLVLVFNSGPHYSDPELTNRMICIAFLRLPAK